MERGKTDAFRKVLIVVQIVALIWNPGQGLGCNDGLHKRSQPSATPPPGAPNRQLEWGDLNILHTTDSHGDLHDGNGLSDAEPYVHPGTPRGSTSSKIFTRVPYDILAIGNHELYDLPIAQDMHDNFAPSWKGSYLTSNVNITTSGTSVPLGSRYRKFVTEQGRKVTAFGIIFHFTGNANGTTVQPPSELVLEPWFKEAIRDKPDLFLLAGHMGIRDPDWKIVLDSIRAIHPEVPVTILGGHYHIRDCQQLDDRSMSLASGRYMETLGWMSLSGLDKPGKKPKFSRRYLDANRVTYQFHAGDKFDTIEGVQTTEKLTKAAEEFDIYHRFGVAPHSFFGYRVPSTSKESLSYLFTGPDGVLETVVKNPKRNNPMLGIVHTTAMRADLYADVPRGTAEEILGILNAGGPVRSKSQLSRLRRHLETKEGVPRDQNFHLGHDVTDHYLNWMRLQFEDHHHQQSVLSSRSRPQIPSTSYGYVTKDQCPGYGDDVIHTPLPVVDQTEYVATTISNDSSDLVDVVFDSFTAKFVLTALNEARMLTISSPTHGNKNYTMEDVEEYSPLKTNQILGIYAQSKWNN